MKKKKERIAAAAELPERMQEGRTVWIWDLCCCDEDGCMDMASVTCPLNHGLRPHDPAALSCRRSHPVLREIQIWAVCCYFQTNGLHWVINDSIDFAAEDLPMIFEIRAEAEKNKPGVVF